VFDVVIGGVVQMSINSARINRSEEGRRTAIP
jgi:hypothetical protein